jgi:two-component system CheB/CheR fusion protein
MPPSTNMDIPAHKPRIPVVAYLLGAESAPLTSLTSTLRARGHRVVRVDCLQELADISDPDYSETPVACLVFVVADLNEIAEYMPDGEAARGLPLVALVTPGSIPQRLPEGADEWLDIEGPDLTLRLGLLEERARIRAEAFAERSRTETFEAEARAIINTIVDGVITIDTRGKIFSVNPAAMKIFGYTESEMVGRNVRMLMPEPYREEHDDYLGNYLETGVARIIGIGREVVGRRSDGSIFPMDLAVSEVQLNGAHLFAGVVRDISDRRHLEQLLLDSSEQERRRIGQDLHDGLGQMLTGIGLITQSLTRQVEAVAPSETASDLVGEMRDVTRLIREADQHARLLARGLVPVELEADGLVKALERMARNGQNLYGITIDFRLSGEAHLHDNTAATHLYRIAQEALSNAVRHGKASHIDIHLIGSEPHLKLRVQDDGVGFPDVLPDEGGLGVRSMQYRARIIGATLDIRKGPDGGTWVTCTLSRTPAERRSFNASHPKGLTAPEA